MVQEALALAFWALCDWLFDVCCFALGRWTVIAVTLGRIRPVRTVRSERWLIALGGIELLTVVVGGFVWWLYA
ncbi:hypothetical protein [Aquipseudomonas campi]